MEKIWVFGSIAVMVEWIDFLDPALTDEPDARERGVRVEVRPASSRAEGSVYASATATLQPAVCRIDLLESRPGAADRMHWHPTMLEGEPGDRVFDAALSADPLEWVTDRLLEVDDLVPDAGLADVTAVRAHVDQIIRDIADGLAWAREPWPEVARDERGLAVS